MVTETPVTSSAADCDPDSTVSQSLGECSSGAKTSTLSIKNNESSATFYKVEYKIDDGSWTDKNTNLEVAGGATNTSLTQSVSEGSTITWRITDSFTSNDWTNMVTETPVTSSAADCDPDSTVSQSLASSCSSGAKISTLSIKNNESSAAFYKVEYKINDGSWTCLLYTSPSPRD